MQSCGTRHFSDGVVSWDSASCGFEMSNATLVRESSGEASRKAANPHVRFDELGWEMGGAPASVLAAVLDSTNRRKFPDRRRSGIWRAASKFPGPRTVGSCACSEIASFGSENSFVPSSLTALASFFHAIMCPSPHWSSPESYGKSENTTTGVPSFFRSKARQFLRMRADAHQRSPVAAR